MATSLWGLSIGLLMAISSSAQTVVVRDAAPPAPPPNGAAAVVAPAVAAVEPAPAEVAIAGTVLRTKQVDVRGTPDKILVALLDTGDGTRQIVELGPTINFRSAPVYTGEQIAIRGERATLGNVDVLVATHAEIAGKKILIHREVPAALAAVAEPAGYPVAEQVLKLEGRVAHLRTSRLRGSRQEHVIAEVVNRGGRAIVVDLGAPSQIWRADVKQGEWITIRGQEFNVNNRPAFLALEITKNGIPYLIDRDLVHVDRAQAVGPATVGRPDAVVTPSTEAAPAPGIESKPVVEGPVFIP